MAMDEIKRDFSRKEAEIFNHFAEKYHATYADKTLYDTQKLLDKHLAVTAEYDQESEPVYQKWEKYSTVARAVWLGSVLTTAVGFLVGSSEIELLAPFCCVGGAALVGTLYCSAKQMGILKTRRSNALETLAIFEVIDDKMDAMTAQKEQASEGAEQVSASDTSQNRQ